MNSKTLKYSTIYAPHDRVVTRLSGSHVNSTPALRLVDEREIAQEARDVDMICGRGEGEGSGSIID